MRDRVGISEDKLTILQLKVPGAAELFVSSVAHLVTRWIWGSFRTRMVTDIPSQLLGQIPAPPLATCTVSAGQRTSSQLSAIAVKEADDSP